MKEQKRLAGEDIESPPDKEGAKDKSMHED